VIEKHKLKMNFHECFHPNDVLNQNFTIVNTKTAKYWLGTRPYTWFCIQSFWLTFFWPTNTKWGQIHAFPKHPFWKLVKLWVCIKRRNNNPSIKVGIILYNFLLLVYNRSKCWKSLDHLSIGYNMAIMTFSIIFILKHFCP